MPAYKFCFQSCSWIFNERVKGSKEQRGQIIGTSFYQDFFLRSVYSRVMLFQETLKDTEHRLLLRASLADDNVLIG